MTYTPDGRRVITGGSNSAIRIYTVGQDGEPKTVDEGVDGHLGIGAIVCRMVLWIKKASSEGLICVSTE